LKLYLNILKTENYITNVSHSKEIIASTSESEWYIVLEIHKNDCHKSDI